MNSVRHVSYHSCEAISCYNENQEMNLDSQIISRCVHVIGVLLHNCIGDFHLQYYYKLLFCIALFTEPYIKK